ncbi:type II toxin-antitoxin system RelE/ParE family toxin [Brachyspira hyodysenteriae]|uniref:RelE, Cytotoxic translational repressor of toxin-antitoxin stability system n=1 Tax=Brachyspira hyodysenteriae (strain ATCC 49526 / WA1) TaxID=565034 RepID=A0A3B6VBA0_BRAHW|nr:type II toxin-antitoxin system RelE/ParE family toxin [Brachyspira hyodysenteriae]ACN84470.1 RelE, Cytotoxic translational repressor of toxin-antitoxin stability system [Brachyspira hyodysenteriae WA1]KLI42447.1 RelE [Brachyspira hyodysenteriae]MBT8719504.1 type II toxin-antitoxin system RelE/ParE family toxin [Brachyspira hyodysenteriae]MBT8729743.1 type II toxin-antitoxin system RelE/ParE family toxin [Brachyspira hyodysenteriae]MBT8731912.1 type II toxin-antitoxin system RelE/ParE family
MKVSITRTAKKSLEKLDRNIQKRILDFLSYLETLENSRVKGKSLKGELKEYWRYRVGDYRILSKIIDNELIILVIDIGHRKDIYDI